MLFYGAVEGNSVTPWEEEPGPVSVLFLTVVITSCSQEAGSFVFTWEPSDILI